MPTTYTSNDPFPEAADVASSANDPFPEASQTSVADPFPEAQHVTRAPVAAEAGFLESLGEVPEQALRLLLSGRDPGFGAENVARHVEDVVRAREGDTKSAKRARAYGTTLSAAASIIPTGPEVALGLGASALVRSLAARSALGALGGAIPAAVEAGAQGDDILPAAAQGAAVGAVANPVFGVGAGYARRAVEKLSRAGKPITPQLARRLQAEMAAEVGVVPDSPVERLIQALRTVPSLQKVQEKLYSTARGQRIGEFEKAAEAGFGEAGAREAMGKLAGRLPRVEFGSLRPLVSQGDVDLLYETAKASPLLSQWDKVKMVSVLDNLLGQEGAQLPTKSELALVEKVFGSRLTQALLDKPTRSWLQKSGALAVEVANASRELKSSFDLSALRQGAFASVGNPREFARAFAGMVSGYGTEKGAAALELEIAQRANFERMLAGGLGLTRPGSVVGGQEEIFRGTLATRLPLGIGKAVQWSERTYTGFLNKLRADLFDKLVNESQRLGLDMDNPAELRKVANYVNAATGRGEIPNALKFAAPVANQVFFSPRLMASRLRLLSPEFYVSSNKAVRMNAIRSALALGTLALTVTEMHRLAGAEVESTDIENPDWMKARFGNVRADYAAGFQQYIRLFAKLIEAAGEGSVEDRATGMLRPTVNFLERKLAPIPSLVPQIIRQTDANYQPLNLPAAVASQYTPMMLQDTWQVMQEMGLVGAPLLVPAAFGLSGVNVYQ